MITDKYRCDWAQAVIYPSGRALDYLEVMPIKAEEVKNKLVLDYGCGGGRDLFVFDYFGAECVGVDIVKSNLKFAKCKVPNANFFYLEDNDKLPFKDKMFDIINSNGVIHHIKDNVTSVINELKRVLKDDGVMYVMLYSEFLAELHKNRIEELQKNTGKCFEEVFGDITDDCDYTMFYDMKKAEELFADFIIEESKLYNNHQFRIFKLKKRL